MRLPYSCARALASYILLTHYETLAGPGGEVARALGSACASLESLVSLLSTALVLVLLLAQVLVQRVAVSRVWSGLHITTGGRDCLQSSKVHAA